MRETLTISTGNRNYTVQGEPVEIDKLFDRLVQATFVPVNQPMFIPPIMGCDLSDGHDMSAKGGVPFPTQQNEEPEKVEEPTAEEKTEEVAPPAAEEPKPVDKPVETVEKPKKPSTIIKSNAVDAPAPVVKDKAVPAPNEEPRKYTGFLVVKCEHCGHTKGFLSRNPISHYKCDCGKFTPLGELVPMTALCECGKRWRYMTNMTEDSFEINCIHCGSPIPVFWNDKKHKYETLFEGVPNHKKGGKKK